MNQRRRQLAYALILLGVLLPLVPLLIWSIAFGWRFPQLWPDQLSLRGWRYLFSPASQLGPAFFNSLVVGLFTTLLSLAIGLPAGRALGLSRFRGKLAVEGLFLAPTIVPAFAAAMGIHIFFIRLGLADTRLGVVLVHLIPVLPYTTLLLSSTFANFDPDYEAQASSLGANGWQRLVFITLPLILPGLIVAGLFAFIISWSQYLLTLLIGGGSVITLPILLFAFANSGDNNITAALSILFVLPAILFLLLSARLLTERSGGLGGFGRI